MTKREKTALVAVVVNSFLTAGKFVLAGLTSSLALLAEAYHSFSDVLASVSVLIAQISDRKSNLTAASKSGNSQDEKAKHKVKIFAPGRWETKVAFVIGVFLFFVAVGIFRRAFDPVETRISYPVLGAILVFFLALLSYLLHRFEKSVGQETGSPALQADAAHAKTDMMVSIFVGVVLLSEALGVRFDRTAAIIISILIFVTAVQVFIRAAKAYVAVRMGESLGDTVIFEDFLVSFFSRCSHFVSSCFWKVVVILPGIGGSPEEVRQKALRVILSYVIVIGVVLYLFSGLYIIKPYERAIIERFGKPLHQDNLVGPGLHYAFPWPVDSVRKVNVEEIRRMAVGYIPKPAQEIILWTVSHYLKEFPIVTGDNSFLNVAMNAHYHVNNAYKYLYSSADPDTILERIGFQVIRENLGIRELFPVITTARTYLEGQIKQDMQALADKAHLGIVIDNILLRDIHPPPEVANSFEQVVSAQIDRERFIQEARVYERDIIPRARGTAAETVLEAEAYKNTAVTRSTGAAQSFTLQRKAFEKTRDITRTRMVLETMEESLSDVKKIIVQPIEKGEKPDLWLNVPGGTE